MVEPRPQRKTDLSAHDRKMEHLYGDRPLPVAAPDGGVRVAVRRGDRFELAADPLKAGLV